MKERDSVSIGLFVDAGGRYEADQLKGAAHFLEHILFKGSRKYSCDEIKEKIEGVGGSLNAFTTEEMTCYLAKVPSRHVPRTFDILADMVVDPLIPKREVEKEKGVIIEEIKMYHDLPQYFVLDLLDGMLWPGHPLGKNLAGSEETVSGMSHTDLRGFHRAHYSARNLVVAACGAVRHQSFVQLVKGKLSGMSEGNRTDFIAVQDSQAKPKTVFSRKGIEQMHLALGMHGLHKDHEDKYIMALLHIILGGNMSSRLFDEVREKRGLAYSISTSLKAFHDTGMFMVRAGVDNRKIVDAVAVILKELAKIKKNGVTAGEFSRAKDYYLGQVQLCLEDTMDHMLWIGESTVAFDRMRKVEEIIRIVKKIKIGDIRRLARDIIRQERFNLAVVGPITGTQEKELNSLIGVKS